jgi:hypothetical protein
MSMHYTLDVATDEEPATLLNFLVETCGFVKLSEKISEKEGVLASVYSEAGTRSSDEYARSIFQKEYGFVPSVAVCFQKRRVQDFTSEEKYVTILRSVIMLLKHFPGDCVLLYDEIGQIVLRRLNDQLKTDIIWCGRYDQVWREGLLPSTFAHLNQPEDRSAENVRSVMRENESAQIMAQAGYRTFQNPPPKPNGKETDFTLEGQYSDCISPNSATSEGTLYTNLRKEVEDDQADIIVVNASDAPHISADSLENLLRSTPISGLRQVFIHRDSKIERIIDF